MEKDPYHPTWQDADGYPFTAGGGTYHKGAKNTTPPQPHMPQAKKGPVSLGNAKDKSLPRKTQKTED